MTHGNLDEWKSVWTVLKNRHRRSPMHKVSLAIRYSQTMISGIVLAILVAACLGALPSETAEFLQQHWTGTWSAAPEEVVDGAQYRDQTLRMIVHTSIGGDSVRIRISNSFGVDRLAIGAAHIAVRSSGARIISGTDRILSFSGKTSVAVPVGALVLSDPVYLDVPPDADLSISVYLPALTVASTAHTVALQTNYVAKSNGNFTDAVDLPGASTIGEWDFLTGVDVLGGLQSSAVIVLGDSVGDGIGSSTDKNRRWPDVLARRLQRQYGTAKAVLNEAITGNRLLFPGASGFEFFGAAGLARLERDVIGQAGSKYLVISLGLNDTAQPGIIAPISDEVTASEIIAGHLQLIERAHEKGIHVLGCTLTPFKDSLIAPGFYSSSKETKRETINEWIRTSGAYDAVIDFDQVLRDPAHPLKIRATYDSGDHTHPNDAGHRALGQAIDLNLFREID
jgi:lysophospholipase L1-like esterase